MLIDMKPNEIEKNLSEGKISIVVVGAGRIGLPTAVLFAKAGAQVTACDINEEIIKSINNCQSYIDEPGLEQLLEQVVKTGHLQASQDITGSTRTSDAVILCVPTPVSEAKVPIYDSILSASKAVGEGLRRGMIVIVESTIAPGTLEHQIIPILEQSSGLEVGKDILVASCPERANPGSIISKFQTIPRVVGGINKNSEDVARALYATIADEIIVVSDPKTANAVKLTENIFRDVNIALVNELAILFERLGIDMLEVVETAASKWNFIPHYPGAGVGGPCLPANAYYLIEEGHKVDYVPYLVRMAREINDRMPLEMVRLTMEALNIAGKSLKGSRVTILGITYKPGLRDVQTTPATPLISELEERGAILTLCDPLIKGRDFQGYIVSGNIEDSVSSADCIIVVTAQEEFKQLDLTQVAKLASKPLVMVDGRGMFKDSEKPRGTIYTGIGLPLRQNLSTNPTST
jgi:nucleotide sugar dehydrogenase